MENENVIFSYTRQDALNDGIFIDVTETAKEAGIKYPVAVTTNLYNKWIKPSEALKKMGQDERGRLWDVIWMFRNAARKTKDSFVEFEVIFLNDQEKPETVTIWAAIEAQSPTDPSPGINILLPEDY